MIPYEVKDFDSETTGRMLIPRRGSISPPIKPTTFLRRGYLEYAERMEMLRIESEARLTKI